MQHEHVAAALARFERATTETLRTLAAAKAEPIGRDQVAEAVACVLGPLKKTFELLPPLPSGTEARIAGCADACSDVVEHLGRTDNLGGQRFHRGQFPANVAGVAFHASWILDALRAAVSSEGKTL